MASIRPLGLLITSLMATSCARHGHGEPRDVAAATVGVAQFDSGRACWSDTERVVRSEPDPNSWWCARSDGTKHGPFEATGYDLARSELTMQRGTYRDGVLDGQLQTFTGDGHLRLLQVVDVYAGGQREASSQHEFGPVRVVPGETTALEFEFPFENDTFATSYSAFLWVDAGDWAPESVGVLHARLDRGELIEPVGDAGCTERNVLLESGAIGTDPGVVHLWGVSGWHSEMRPTLRLSLPATSAVEEHWVRGIVRVEPHDWDGEGVRPSAQPSFKEHRSKESRRACPAFEAPRDAYPTQPR